MKMLAAADQNVFGPTPARRERVASKFGCVKVRNWCKAQHHRARGRDIFKENHRFSEKTPQPEPHSVVDAANLAASSRGSRTTFAVCDLVVRAEQGGSDG